VRVNRVHSIRLLIALAASLLVSGCGGSSSGPESGSGLPVLGAPISPGEGTPLGTTGWSFVAFPDSICTDNPSLSGTAGTSTTGIVISQASGAPADAPIVFFLNGGGACWDSFTCSQGIATTGPFQAAEALAQVAALPGSILDRTVLTPLGLGDATLVFVPYCTGDVHSGDNVAVYSPTQTWHHKGRANLVAFLTRLAPTFPLARAIVVTGSSAGGFGALANYPLFRSYWPAAQGALVDDSGPPLIGTAVPSASLAAWYASWNLGPALDPYCSGCRTDLSRSVDEIASRFPSDRLALLSYTQDYTVRTFFFTTAGIMPAATFQTALLDLGQQRFDNHSSAGYFFSDGSLDTPVARPATTHTMLGAVATHRGGATPGVTLSAWLEAMIADSGTAAPWGSVKP
jgi:hypothetical protein